MSSILAVDESPGKMYALSTILSTLAILAVALRVIARRTTKSDLSWDDFLIAIGLVCPSLLRSQLPQKNFLV